MDVFQVALAGGALLAFVVAYPLPRARLWILLLAASFVTSTMWQKAGLPHRELFGAATNVAICVCLYFMARQRWEMVVFNCLIMMTMLDAIYAVGFIEHYWLITALEFCNWMAILTIGATGYAERVGDGSADRRGNMGLADFSRGALLAPRAAPSIVRRE